MDGTNLELIAHNFRNNYECCVNSFGEIWLSDNDDDGNQQTRICFVMPGGNYGYGPRGPGQSHWHEEQPGIVHKVLRTGFGSPTGITFYEGSMFPAKYRGALLHCDAGPREVRWFHIKPKGAGYELEKELLLTSTDNWFRPSDVCVAPDGSVIVADWYDRGVGGHGMGDPTDGRIYRITPKEHRGYKVPEVKLGTKEEVLEALRSPCLASRSAALGRLASMKPNDAADFLFDSCFIKDDSISKIRSIQAYFQMMRRSDAMKLPSGGKYGDMADKVGESMGSDRDSRFRCFWMKQLETEGGTSRLEELLLKAIIKLGKRDMLRELLVASRHTPPDNFSRWFYELAKLYDGSDHFYRAALNIACGTDPARRDAILADFDRQFPEWNDRVADLVWELRPKSVLPRLGKLLTDAKLTAAQKARVVDILAVNDDVAAGKTMLEVLKGDAVPEVKTRAIQNLTLFLPTKWKALAKSDELHNAVADLLDDPKARITGLRLVAAARYEPALEAVAWLAAEPKAPLDTRREAVRTLGEFKVQQAIDALALFSRNEDLRIDAVRALGMVRTDASLTPLKSVVQDGKLPVDLRLEAVAALAASQPGTIWLLNTHQKSSLPKEVLAQAGRLLRNSPFQGERNRALLLFPAPGKLNPKNLPPIAELAKRSGDAARGKAVWAASFAGAAQCSKCHMIRGAGGSVGPDLAMIGKKSAREALYESILQPSKAIADQYLQHQVTTTAEVTIAGLLVADTPESITLRDANGKDTTIPRKEIAGEVRKLKISIMPEDVVAALTEDDLTDLVAYLETLKTPALTPEAFHVVGPFRAPTMEEALDREFGPEKGPFDPKAEFRIENRGRRIPTVRWSTIRPDGKGYFDLAALHGAAANNSASYMYAEIDSPVEQGGEVLLGVDDGARMWLNGKEVFTTRETKAAAPEQHRVAVKLAKGKNAVLLKVANGNNPHGFFFSLTSVEETKVVPVR
jgi:putative heme-binding domain-containing protein